MNDVPGVCIMIPTYNQAGYIAKAIESALAQDYPNIEIVIADDNSTDNTQEVMQKFIKNPAIKYRKNVTNLGRVANYRKCLNEYAGADWVLNLDGDDHFTNTHFISHAMQAIQSNGINDTLFFQGVHILKFDEVERFTVPNIVGDQECIKARDYFLNYFERNYFSHMSTLYNRVFAIEANFYEIDIISTDIFSFLRLCLKFGEKNVIVSKNIAGVWLQHDNNTSKTLHLRKHWNNFRLYIDLYRIAVKNGYSRPQGFKWLIKAGYHYLAGYILRAIEIFRAK